MGRPDKYMDARAGFKTQTASVTVARFCLLCIYHYSYLLHHGTLSITVSVWTLFFVLTNTVVTIYRYILDRIKNILLAVPVCKWGRRCRYRMVVGLTTTNAVCAYHH